MPKAKPVSLHPLSFEEAIEALMKVDPKKKQSVPKQNKGKKSL